MTSLSIPPSTLDGIKRRAKSIKRERSFPHHQALDVAAHEAGYQNFRHAQAVLASAALQTTIYLTCYWVERRGEIRKRGRETLAIPMAKSLGQIVSRHQLDHARHLAGFRMESADHLERKLDVDSLERAKTELRRAARSLQFMAATGLTPATTQRQRNLISRKVEGLPGRDHPSLWMTSDGSGWVYMDEPYKKPSLDERAGWALQRGLIMERSSWDGLYYPGNAIPFLFGADVSLMALVRTQLAGLPTSEQESGLHWTSDKYFTQFASPARVASGKPRRARPMPAIDGIERRGALPYGHAAGGSTSLWRPAQRMPLHMHLAVGPIFRALAVSGLEFRVTERLGKVQSLLDNWIQMEYPGDEMSTDQFHAAYYGESAMPLPEPAQQLAAVQKIRETLVHGYKPCKPRDTMLAQLDAVEAHFTNQPK